MKANRLAIEFFAFAPLFKDRFPPFCAAIQRFAQAGWSAGPRTPIGPTLFSPPSKGRHD
jgi:hypothetical protein